MVKGLLVGAAVLLLGSAPEGTSGQELKELQGDWQLVDLVRSGKHLTLKGSAIPTMVRVQGTTLTFISQDNSRVARIKVKPGEKYHEIDLTPISGPQKGMKLKGLFQIKGDTFALALDETGNGRPAQMVPDKSDPESIFLAAYKRVKQ